MERRGIVNGHWEPTERHSRLLELVRVALAKLAKKTEAEAVAKQERDSERNQRRADWNTAAE